ncbi:hypothetical protein ES705_16852 [subsurface metagenome]
MFYAFTHKCNDSAVSPAYTYPYDLNMDLTAGVIHQVDVLFQAGCSHLVGVQIHQGGHQLWPSNRGAYLRGNATVVSFREFYNLSAGNTDLYAIIDADASIIDIEIIIQIGLLPKRVLQPLSFEELVAAASGV